MKYTLATAAVAAIFATTALASGPIAPIEPYIAPVVPVAYDWTGPYVGLRIGAPTGDNNWAERGVGAEATPGAWGGTLYGLTAGYDRQQGSYVFGAAIDYTGGTMTAQSTTNPGPPAYNCLAGCDTRVENQYAIRGRIGRAMDRTLVYVTAGFASGEATASSVGPGTLGSGRLNGWTGGFGLEHAVTNRFTISVEYLFTDLGRLEIPTACNLNCFTDVSYGALRIGANLRF